MLSEIESARSALMPSAYQRELWQAHLARQARYAAGLRLMRLEGAAAGLRASERTLAERERASELACWRKRCVLAVQALRLGIAEALRSPRAGFDPELVRGAVLRAIHIGDIQRAVVGRHDGVCLIDILSSRRTLAIVRPRQIAIYLAKVLTLKSMPEVGRYFGGRDHTTVLHAVRKIGRLMQDDARLRALVEGLRAAIFEAAVQRAASAPTPAGAHVAKALEQGIEAVRAMVEGRALENPHPGPLASPSRDGRSSERHMGERGDL